MDILKEIPDFPGYYINTSGRVWSTRSNNWLKYKQSEGHLCVRPTKQGIRYIRKAHRLVLETYVGPRPEGMQCRHINGRQANVDLDNLCWDTSKQNGWDRVQRGSTRRGEQQESAKLTEQDVLSIRAFWRGSGPHNQRNIAKMFGVSRMCINKIINRKTWRHLK